MTPPTLKEIKDLIEWMYDLFRCHPSDFILFERIKLLEAIRRDYE